MSKEKISKIQIKKGGIYTRKEKLSRLFVTLLLMEFLLTFLLPISTINTYAKAKGTEFITTCSMHVRKQPSLKSKAIGGLRLNELVLVFEIKPNGWAKIKFKNGYAFVSSQYLRKRSTVKKEPSASQDLPTDTTASPNNMPSKINETRNAVINYANKFIGLNYHYGGTSLKTGVDCSGFTQAIYKKFGYTLNRTSIDQRKNGKKVKVPVTGDLIFYDPTEKYPSSHVAIYIGNEQIIHAGGVKTGVHISKWNYRPVHSIRRIIF